MQQGVFEFDVAVIGGGIAGSATALQLLRGAKAGCACGKGRGCSCGALDRPLRVVVIERQESLGRRVGESTVELSTYFLTRVLGLTRHLNEKHTVKQGFRYWFANEDTRGMGCCTEMGGRYLSRVGSFQVDREVLDAEVLRRVEELGGELWRPARVRRLELEDGGTQTLTVKIRDEERTVKARWVVDASGKQAMVARQRDEVTPIEGHPTAAVWARWKNTLDFDGQELVEKYPGLGEGFAGTRHTATNHIMGDGWWAWVIPLKDGHTSVGVTWDQRLFEWPRESGGTLGDQLRAVLSTHPTGRELLENAEWVEGDVHVRRNLPYLARTPMGDGFLLVGDAVGFIDPFYSMGLDSLSMTSISGSAIVLDQLRGGDVDQAIARHNQTFRKTFPRWFEAIFRDKYTYMGDFELMRVAFLVDIALYYFGIVMQPYTRGKRTVADGMFAAWPALPFYGYMRWTNRRLAAIAMVRRRRGTWGRRNVGRRVLVPGFAFDTSIPKAVAKGLWAHLKLEVTDGWRCWRPRRGPDDSVVTALSTSSLGPEATAPEAVSASPPSSGAAASAGVA